MRKVGESEKLFDARAKRCTGFADAVAPAIIERKNGIVYFDLDHPARAAAMALCRRSEPKPASSPKAIANHRAAEIKPVPRDQWPAYINLLAKLATPADKGIGDVVARHLGASGETFKTVFKKLTGKDCGCSDRQARLNALYPLVPG